MTHEKDYLSSKYLRDRTLPVSIKRTVIKSSLLLFLYNSIIFHRNDKIYFVVSLFGALVSIFDVNIKTKLYFAMIMTFWFILFQNPFLLYIMYGFVAASTYYYVSHICHSLSTECMIYFRKIEVLFLIVPCFVSFENKILCASLLTIITTVLYFCKRPACEIIEKNHKCYLNDVLESIQDIIVENDYCLIVEEQRRVLRFHRNMHDEYEWNCFSFLDFLLPLWFCQTDNLLKAWIFLSFNLGFIRHIYVIPVLYLTLLLDYYLVAIFVAPGADWSFQIGKGKLMVFYTILLRLISGYVAYLAFMVFKF